ncbi:quinone-dependent dihydroorotate dehydrogenase [Nakamurella sp. YIM 132087]|uniref:Dihydroorotate dehydrogenase (quinone) n=1 Tax=Nakamurella alba TaxID=2665158 RepID=A0A7K1FFR7_9ACTN|nr:quinone-dependent dihydroorotate dehydrogenase [Nakamurella alba]MTD12952.1 quinone-dependent dihydroorotate dehydrogenase [Nakamurella alba]
MTVLDAAYRRVARPVLFRLGRGDAETAHHTTLRLLSTVGKVKPARTALHKLLAGHRLTRTVFGVDFPAAVGLAAGMDKDGAALRAWPSLGFGFVEVGTVTAVGQPGNDRPRLFRLRESGAIINRMGFNNAGAEALAATLRRTGPIDVPLGISLGKSKITPVDEAVGDYLTSLRLLHDRADYIAVNVSSPNTPGLRGLQDKAPLDELLGALTEQAALLASPDRRAGRPVPVLVKIAPDLDDAAIGDLLQVCADRGIAGIIATNTTLSRDGLRGNDSRLASEAGGLSGDPLRSRALEVVRFVAGHCDLPVIGVGGLSQPEHGLAMLDAGASLLQLYTGFIYQGPGLVTGLNKAILQRERQSR